MKNLCRVFSLAIFLFTAVTFMSSSPLSAQVSDHDKPAKKPGKSSSQGKKNAKEELAVLETSMGTIKFRFYGDVAPKHVENFKNLARSGFYDGTYFHRVIPGFMIQGGDPNTKDSNRDNDGMGGSGKNVPAEFSSKSHKRGVVSMARSMDPNSASSQFFICVADAPHLNGQYSAFGEVVDGMPVVDKIVNAQRDGRDNPIQKITLTKVTIQ